MTKPKSANTVQPATNEEQPMSTPTTMTKLELDTIAAKATSAEAFQNCVNIDKQIRDAAAAVEEKIVLLGDLSARLGQGIEVPPEALIAAAREVEAARQYLAALRETVPASQHRFTLAERALRLVLADELRRRLGISVRREAALLVELETVRARIAGIHGAVVASEVPTMEIALERWPAEPDLDPAPVPTAAAAAE